VLVGGDLGGPVIQDVALRFPGFATRMVLFNSPLPFDAERFAGLQTRPATEAADYFIRQGTDPDGLAADLASDDERRRYIATFYTSRFWAHPGAFTPDEVAFHTEPFADAAKLRASFGAYESVFDPERRSEPSVMAMNDVTPTMLLFGPSDHVIYPDFDRMAARVFAKRVGPFLLRDCGHFVQWEAADVLTSAITAWVS
jgi:pimeloyl-ACP methyl ester carboxylesterase